MPRPAPQRDLFPRPRAPEPGPQPVELPATGPQAPVLPSGSCALCRPGAKAVYPEQHEGACSMCKGGRVITEYGFCGGCTRLFLFIEASAFNRRERAERERT